MVKKDAYKIKIECTRHKTGIFTIRLTSNKIIFTSLTNICLTNQKMCVKKSTILYTVDMPSGIKHKVKLLIFIVQLEGVVLFMFMFHSIILKTKTNNKSNS